MAQPRVTSTAEVLAAAAKVFHEKGYKGATLDDIAEAAGVSKPTLYKYIKDKQSILDSISQVVRESNTNLKARNVGLSGLEKLSNTFVAAAEVADSLHYFYKATISNARELSENAAQETRAWRRVVTKDTEDILRQCREEGSLDLPGNMAVYANLVQSMVRGIFYWYDPNGPVAQEELAQHMLKLLGAQTDLGELEGGPQGIEQEYIEVDLL